jgi:hypothetical protein
MDIRYHGPYDEVAVPLPGGASVAVPQGGVVTVPDDIGRALLLQPDNWKPAKSGTGRGER